ncbi:MAG: T9SS type A sorting domain-containing protein [Crocinitomicaceae bacterium]|nr:T9SS type A sorting domain-containing protein [Flavobacteriales bacterium]NQZ34058.1 T9SS type A sorting domain-containing protein [Crocinitomicaceae bacterium]
MKNILIFLCISFQIATNAQIEFDVCIPISWVGGGSGEITFSNGSGTTIPAGSTFEINWPGITSISPWSGFTVTGSNPYFFTINSPILAGGSLGPLGFGFTNGGSYFAPGMAILNGATPVLAVSPPCYIPPSYQNFDCEKEFNELCFIPTESTSAPGEIRLGLGTVHSWNSILDVYIPTNKKNWAIAMGVGHSMFTNLVGMDALSINEYFATVVQETNCGCDGTILEPAWVTNVYPDHENINPINCYDFTHGVAVGFFQEEYGTGWLELNQDIPCFIPTFNFDSTIVGKNFSAQMIGKVYHDYNNLMFLQYIKCYDILGFMENCNDPYGPEKLIAAIYNRGMNAGFIEDILVTNRAAALASPDLLNFIPGLGQQYAEQISRVTAVLDGNMSNVSALGTIAYTVPWPGMHSNYGYYNEQISWTDVTTYLDSLELMYAGVGVIISDVKSAVQPTFDAINLGGTISYRYQFGPVADAIVLALPAFEPMSGLGNVYGNSGGNACSFPTANMDSSTVICEGESTILEIYLTGSPPWEVSYNFNGINQTISNINSSPYLLSVSDDGLYYLNSVTDNTGTSGKAICDSVNISFDPNCLILPIELNDFYATVEPNNSVRLNWSTFSEYNNDYFTVERSRFGLFWEEVRHVQGAENSQQWNEYLTFDTNPMNGMSYYRLRQTDFDGQMTFSDLRSVNINGSQLEVFPNPTNAKLTLTGNALELETIRIYTVLGQDVTSMVKIINQTRNEVSIDLSNLESGLYSLQTKTNCVKIIKN